MGLLIYPTTRGRIQFQGVTWTGKVNTIKRDVLDLRSKVDWFPAFCQDILLECCHHHPNFACQNLLGAYATKESRRSICFIGSRDASIMAKRNLSKDRPRGRNFRKAQGRNGIATSSNSVDLVPRQKTALISGDSKSEDDDTESEQGGVNLLAAEDGSPVSGDFRINEEYAARFLHNKKREELQRCRD